ncbi:MAG: tetratricopeptide repeat protein [Brevinema sp.]
MSPSKLLLSIVLIPFLLHAMPSAEEKIQNLIDKGDYAQAFSQLKIYRDEFPSGYQYYSLSAQLLYAMNSFSEAYTNIYQAIAQAPANPTNYLIMGNTLRRLGNNAHARGIYNKGLSIDASYGQLYLELARLSLEEQKLAEAERYLKLAENFSPDSWSTRVLSAKVMLERGRTNESERAFLQIANAYPQNITILDELASFFAQQGKFDKATEALKEAEMRFGENIYRSQLIGDYAFRRGAFNEALRYYQHVKNLFGGQVFSGSSIVSWRLFQLYSAEGNLAEAETNLRNAFEQQPDNQLYYSAFIHFLAQNYPPNNSYRAAIASFTDKLAAKERNNGYGNFYLSLIYKWALIDPLNNKPYQELINFAKIHKNERMTSELLQKIVSLSPQNAKALTTLRMRNQLSSTGRLDDKIAPIYSYKALIFVDDPTHQSAFHFANESKFYSSIFSRMDISTATESFSQASRDIFRAGKYGLVIHAEVKPSGALVRVFDKKGSLILSQLMPYNPESFTKDILAILRSINNMLPPIAYFEQRLPNNIFRVSIGEHEGVKSGDILNIYDKNFSILGQMTVTEAQAFRSSASINPGKAISLGDGSDFFITPADSNYTIAPNRLFIPESLSNFSIDPFDKNNTDLEKLSF